MYVVITVKIMHSSGNINIPLF